MSVGAWYKHFLQDSAAQVRLALPIMGAQVAQTGMSLVDTLMTGHFAAVDLAAVSVGASLWLPLYLFIVGVLLAVTPHVARAFGAGEHHGLAAYLQNALWLSLVLGIAGGGLLLMSRPLFDLMGVGADVSSLSVSYLAGVAAGFPAIALYQVLRGFSEGMHNVRPVLLIGLMGLLFNIPANYVLIYGGLGLPPMGALGCGIATGLSMWVMLLAMVCYILRTRRFGGIALFGRFHPMRLRQQWETLRIGVPIGLTIFFEVSMFAVIALLVAGLGTTVVAAHQVALNYSSLLFMVPLSMGMALTVQVGHGLGHSGPALARRRSISGMLVAAAVGLIVAIFMVMTAGPVVRLYTPDPDIQALAASLIWLAAIFQLSDTLQVNANGALRGYKDTRVAMLITLPAYWGVGLGVGFWLGRSALPPGPLGVEGFWYGLLAGLSTAAVLLGWRLHHITRARLLGHGPDMVRGSVREPGPGIGADGEASSPVNADTVARS